jgi:hypothetical protein
MRTAHDTEAQSLPGIAYSVHSGTTPKMERSVLANVYRYVLKSKATGLTNTNGTSVRNKEEVSDVGQDPIDD